MKKIFSIFCIIVIGVIIVGIIAYQKKWIGHIDKFWQIRDSYEQVEFVNIEGGCSLRGDSIGDGLAHERPVHEVCIDSFRMSKFEITNEQYAQFILDVHPHYYKPDYWLENGFNADHQPVVGVSWFDAMAYCNWLSSKTGKKIRLPTEAEWEYAARGGSLTKYTWGNDMPPAELMGNFPDLSAKNGYRKKNPKVKGGLDVNRWTVLDGYDDGYVLTAPVGQFPPNKFGLYDMTGNVFEWCLDKYDPVFYSKEFASLDNSLCRSSDSGERVIRGGSWYYSWKFLTLSSRQHYPPWKKYGIVGFRVVQEISQE